MGPIELPPMLKQGERARLFPILADTSRENRLSSIFLAVLSVVPDLAFAVFSSTGIKVGKRAKIEVFTEIILNDNSEIKNRPDGLISITNGKITWSALVESKIGKVEINADQVMRYMDAAKLNKIDSVITISNQFVARADLSPVQLSKIHLRKCGLFHWSWMWIATQCEILLHKKLFESSDQEFIVREFLRLLKHSNTGVEGFTQMPASWKDVVQAVANLDTLKKTSSDVTDAVEAWFSELRDLSLQMSRHVGQSVTTRIERKHLADQKERLRDGINYLTEKNCLKGTFTVPDSAGDIEVTADLARRAITVAMKVRSPEDRKSTKARVNWLLRMLKEDDDRLFVRAHWPGRKQSTLESIKKLRSDPEAICAEPTDTVPHTFEILLVETGAKRFSGRRTFIEDLEAIVPKFYDLVGQNLRAWQAPPPKPVKIEISSVEDGSDSQGSETIV